MHGAPKEDSSEEWTGQQKMQSKIRETLHIPEGTDLCHSFRAVHCCKTEAITYAGQRNVNKTLGQPSIIAGNWTEAQIIADCMEYGMSSIPQTWIQVNCHQKASFQPSVTIISSQAKTDENFKKEPR
jgi:hypothetical protein